MRWVVVVCSMVLALWPMSAQSAPSSAPADEYFGRQKMSVLEIRNRLHDFEAKSDADIAADPKANLGIDDVEDATMDWMTQYPDDSWLPDVLDRLVHAYERAHATTSGSGCSLVIGALVTHYPGSAQTQDALASLGASSNTQTAVSVSGTVVDGNGAPVAGALVLAAPSAEVDDPHAAAAFAITASDGSFSLSGLPSGTIYLHVEPPHGSTLLVGHASLNASETQNDAGQIVLAAQ